MDVKCGLEDRRIERGLQTQAGTKPHEHDIAVPQFIQNTQQPRYFFSLSLPLSSLDFG